MSSPSPSKGNAIPVRMPNATGLPRSDSRANLTGDERSLLGRSPRIGGWAGTPPPQIPARVSSAASLSSRQQYGTPGEESVLDVLGRGDASRSTPIPQNIDELPDEEKARVLRLHLVSREERERRPSSTLEGASRPNLNALHKPSSESMHHPNPGGDDAEFPIPYDTPGGDITHGIYKWQSGASRDALRRTRSTSFSGEPRVTIDPSFQHIHEPGGFRRNYLALRANEQGVEPPVVSNSFIDFLYLFGHYGGEDLEDDEDEDEIEEDEEAPIRSRGTISDAEAGLRHLQRRVPGQPDLVKAQDESQPLLARTQTARSLSRSRRRARSVSGAGGDATVTQAVLMLLKSFIGTGILFLGRAFYNGGILFSALVLAFIALISLYSFILLVKTKFVVSGSFGDIGGALYGKWMRIAILVSIVVSQLGFVAAYTIFIASNFQAFIAAVTNCRHLIPIQYLIFAQIIVLLPLSLVRSLAKLSGTALVADAFILIGLVYIGSNEFAVIARDGISDVALFNPASYPLLIGTAVFSFEGIGLVIPITDAMKEPRKFPKVLSGVMVFLMFLFGGAGVLSYAAYGSNVQTVILVNLPQDQKFVQVVQFLYATAILLSTPLQLFPAIRIMENGLFTKSGKTSNKVKWEKNAFRALMVLVCYLTAWMGASDLDKFVSFIGSFACIPLCYVYPAMLHLKACARTRWARTKDYLLIVFGIAAAIFTTFQTIKLMIAPSEGGEPEFGKCSPAGPGDMSPIENLMGYMGLGF